MNTGLNKDLDKCIRDCWLEFTYLWGKFGSSLDNELKEFAKSLRDEGILDTKPFSPNPRKSRYLQLTNWINALCTNTQNTSPSSPLRFLPSECPIAILNP